MSPSGRVVLVTGAGRGIGRAVAEGLARDGMTVVVASRTESEVDAVAADIRASGGRAVAAVVDVCDAASVERLFEQMASGVGAPSVLVNSAGAAGSHKFEGHPDELWDTMLAVNLTGTYRVTKAAAPAMLAAGWGRVVNIGSVASLTGARYIAAYTAAKHGVLGLTRALAAEWVRSGITVNLIAPGYVDTPMTEGTVRNISRRTGMTEADALAAVTGQSPQRRLVQPEEIVPVVRLLLSAASVTGAVIPVDGGASAFAASG